MSGKPPDDFYPFGHGFDQPPPQARSFSDWAPLVIGHLQRIESSQAVLIRDVAVMQARMESDREWRADVEARLATVENKQHASAIIDAGRVGAVAGGWRVWSGIVTAAAAVGGAVGWLLNLPKH